MTSTVADLANDVMSIRLGAIDLNESQSASEMAKISRLYAQKYAELSRDDRVYWPFDEIPDLVCGALSRIIAEEIAPGLGMQPPTEPDEDGTVVSMGTKGHRMLRRLLSREATGLRVKAEYF